jgi:predicted nucleic-acid-binding protein
MKAEAIDTNVLVRFLAWDEDEPKQTILSRDLAKRLEQEGTAIFVGFSVLMETVWVLSRAFSWSQDEIAIAVRALLENPQFVLEDGPLIQQACESMADRGLTFPDALIVSQAERAKALPVWTFDRRAKRDDPRFQPLQSADSAR